MKAFLSLTYSMTIFSIVKFGIKKEKKQIFVSLHCYCDWSEVTNVIEVTSFDNHKNGLKIKILGTLYFFKVEVDFLMVDTSWDC